MWLTGVVKGVEITYLRAFFFLVATIATIVEEENGSASYRYPYRTRRGEGSKQTGLEYADIKHFLNERLSRIE